MSYGVPYNPRDRFYKGLEILIHFCINVDTRFSFENNYYPGLASSRSNLVKTVSPRFTISSICLSFSIRPLLSRDSARASRQWMGVVYCVDGLFNFTEFKQLKQAAQFREIQ